jgi:hypothetical protein
VADTLQEFLVNLGFNVDENSFGKFQTRVATAAVGVTNLGVQVTTTVLAIQAGVAKMATAFEEMFYISQRTNTSVQSLTSFGNAARTIGLTSDAARGAVEGLSRAMRGNPGVSALLNQLGVKTRGREATDVMMDLVGQLRKMPFYLAQQYASIAGIDGDTLLMLQQRYDELRAADEKYKKQLKDSGVDTDQLAAKSRTFNNALRGLETTLGILGNRIHDNFIGPATKMIGIADEAVKKFIELDKATNGWATTIGTIATSALGAWIAKMLLARALGLGGAAAGGVAGAVAGGVSRAAIGRGGGIVGAGLMGAAAIKADAESGHGIRSWLRRQLGIVDEQEPAPWQKGGSWGHLGSEEQKKRRSRVIDFFTGKGWNRAQATGIAANVGKESSFNEKAVGDGGKAVGLAQWHPDRQANFKKWAGKSIQDATFEDQLGFIQHELTEGAEQRAGQALRAAGSPEQAAAAVSKFYERPANGDREAMERGGVARRWYDEATVSSGGGKGGGANVQVTQNNEFNVSTSDPNSAARQVLGKQGDANSRVVREMKSVVE